MCVCVCVLVYTDLIELRARREVSPNYTGEKCERLYAKAMGVSLTLGPVENHHLKQISY